MINYKKLYDETYFNLELFLKFHNDQEKMIGELSKNKNWTEFSLNPQSEDDIRARIILAKKYPHGLVYKENKGEYAKEDSNTVCLTYVCENSSLSEEFIEELSFLTSNIFDYEYYDQKYIDAYCDIISLYDRMDPDWKDQTIKYLKSRTDLDRGFIKICMNKLKNNSIIKDRLDWVSIFKFQKLSAAFRLKYRNMPNSLCTTKLNEE